MQNGVRSEVQRHQLSQYLNTMAATILQYLYTVLNYIMSTFTESSLRVQISTSPVCIIH